ncbi:small nuclear ribonucleoprotein D3 [Monocercomonoides exilis]|uniref:small nuclear ribonucleoprotein D3 n=1 Tax=Monocercomonoides exilis TaxID=2049356 RepID=UPI00355A3F72|nr:small nuclear ribonucleoprotein D3 [Monocercomonoides exilis]|eukprot:MONOS_257.1-p1 / transcript=MONOS_257.1 / gene=MONOS_257 / organism=Monocercomonoides_exilis_PA203 / gene_product=small nuclear ribonucleoprotein D3 / transcript_product=small nuclear ribonucleoprotein D3 / location=Mono_scaffold00004:152033-152634(+) / protein_length=124 / sequence_SO=supercontig / SO=protein_coding / is_pseudo=false
MSIGIPIKLLHEAEGHIVTIELKTHETYKGKLIEAEDNFNCRLENVFLIQRDGSANRLENVYVRGSQIRFFIMPSMLQNAPMFKNLDPSRKKTKGIGMGVGRTQASQERMRQTRGGRGGRGGR